METTMSDHLVTAVSQGVMTVRMNRPEKKNALTAAMYRSMTAAIGTAEQDRSVQAILVLGIPGAFSAGNDIADFIDASGSGGALAAFDFLEKLIMVSKPVIAGVDGLAIGIGTTMLMHCDYVVASDRSVFRTPFVDLGLVTEAGSSLIGPRIMGHHRAFSLLVLGEAMNADEARMAGLVNRIVESGNLEAAAGEIAAKIAEKPAEALRATHALVRGDRSDVLARMRQEASLFEERLQSAEARAAFAAFMDKGQEKSAKDS